MMFQLRLNASYDSDLISIAYGGIFDPTIIFKKAIDAFVRKEPLSFRSVPEHAKLCEPKGSSRINLDFHDVYEEDVINYITLIPDGSRNEVLKHIIRRMISNDFYYALFNFDDYFSPTVSSACSSRIRVSLDELERSVNTQIAEIKEQLTSDENETSFGCFLDEFELD